MAFDNIRDESVRKLAETLRASGMAASDSEAIRMAQEMSSTANKVQKGYDEQDEKPQVGTTDTQDAVQRIGGDIEYDQGEALNETKIPDEAEATSLYEQQAAAINAGMASSNNSVSGNIVQEESESDEYEPDDAIEDDSREVKEESKRDNSDMAESKIDLSDVFNFGK